MSRLKQFIAVVFGTILVSTSVKAAPLVLPHQDTPEDTYASKVIKQALANENIHSSIEHHPQSLSGERLENAFDEGEIQIMWQSGVTVSDSTHFVLNIPVFRGLMNSYRIVARKGDNIPSLSQLKRLEIGMFRDDGIIPLLQQSLFKVVKVKHTDNLKTMLRGERFDVALGPVARLSTNTAQDLVGSDFIVNIENPWFFTVHNSRPELAKALQSGLEAMLDSGELDTLLNATPWMVNLVEELDNPNTQIVTLPYSTQTGFELAQEFMLVDSTSALLTASF